MRAFEEGASLPEPFDALACDLARFQASRIPGYARLCRARGVDLPSLCRAIDAPAVPTDVFKRARIATFPESKQTRVFYTSGTTVGARGRHVFRDLATYDEASLALGRRALTSGLPLPAPLLVLASKPSLDDDSSLVHMLSAFVAALGEPASEDETYFVDGDVLATSRLEARVARARQAERPVLLLGTSFAYVHLLDALGDERLPLPPGSRLMQTGGFKGRSREVRSSHLGEALAWTFGLPPRSIVSEYGMTELSSQFYEATLLDPGAPHGVYMEPPWARVVPVDPEALRPVPEGEVGLARVEDLANVDSAFAVQTQDRARRVEGGFELLGRAPGAPPRGCSIAIDEILGASEAL